MNYAALAARAQSQSPSLRGSGRFMHLIIRLLLDALEVSIPFIAGQWSLPLLQRLRHVLEQGLNPLHCGAVVASHRVDRVGGDHRASQSPSLRGSGRFSEAEERAKAEAKSQSPSLRGSGRFAAQIGADLAEARVVSIPFIAGQWSLHFAAREPFYEILNVSIPFIAGQWSLQLTELAKHPD